MKSKDLIAELKKLDPEGEIEVSVGNQDIHFCTVEPAYWDGNLQVLSRDHSKDPYYNITGAKYVCSGKKLVIYPLSIHDVLWNDPDKAIIDYSELSEVSKIQYEESDNRTRQASRDCERRVAMDGFYMWAKKQALLISDDLEGLRSECDNFYTNKLNPNDSLKAVPLIPDKDGNMWNPSISERRESEWNDRFEVIWVGNWEIHERDNPCGA